MHFSIALAGVALLSVTTAYNVYPDEYEFQSTTTDDAYGHDLEWAFKHGPPSTETLYWYPCYKQDFVCAKLLVPLDYDNATGPSISTAWIKYMSSNDSAQDILVNPGGPGGSGVQLVRNNAKRLAERLGDQYNFVGFDPRGVGSSEPALHCLTARSIIDEPSTSAPAQHQYQFAKAAGEYCTQMNADAYARYVGTVAVAQDIMHFLDLRHAREVRHRGNERTKSSDDQETATGKAMLWFYGISYGTIIGQTIAALYPDRIGRMILDGNVYGVQHYAGVEPAEVDTTDAAFQDFFARCFEAGPDVCSYHGGAASVDDIENRFIMLLQDLREMPAIIAGPSKYGVLTDIAVLDRMFDAMYTPLDSWKGLSDYLTDIETGSTLAAYEKGMQLKHHFDQTWGKGKASAYKLISCIDSDNSFDLDNVDDFENARELYLKESYYFGNSMSLGNLLACVGMDVTPPSSQQLPGFNSSGTRTSFPLLFVNPVRDVITPLCSAQKMSKLFPGSSVFAVDSTGHSTLSTLSECMVQAYQDYLEHGILPPPGKICQPDVKPEAYFTPNQQSGKVLLRQLLSPFL